jgi:hypothetical protein
VRTLPDSGKVGAVVKILGNNLTHASTVTFGGIAATFTILSPSLIKATVPTGATTGTVQVLTPSGTLSSNMPFRVPSTVLVGPKPMGWWPNICLPLEGTGARLV